MRKEQSKGGALDDMIAYVDDYGNILDSPPEEPKKDKKKDKEENSERKEN